ncbi:hypothetical protein A1O1_07074 [Capronia coronata CBS 617.96]|uniref:Glutathione S-transferase n=1 Tax=Capronia coronata CBS 617.96 TaxID=1182541 RepID=W9Y2J8_9EURO|nr:uncharacterized protein A1O1_07074 [Capronia coronata CBS 617.96]EXJ83451.1 hypothetical protein A1O1_07074 [Capronia coronata CBS 617.96]
MTPTITLYTAHHCPFAHRVQVALRELGLKFETCLVDITVPRTPEYLAINPNGMVPALVYGDLVLTESGLICQFLADSYPSHLLKASTEAAGALQRFKIGYFIDTYFGKAHPLFDSTVFSNEPDAKMALATQYIEAMVRHVEPLLGDAAPFFGGSNRPTLAEVLTAPFLLRVLTLPKHDELVPSFVPETLERRAPKSYRWAQAVTAEQSVTAIWDEDLVVKRTLERIEKRKAAT